MVSVKSRRWLSLRETVTRLKCLDPGMSTGKIRNGARAAKVDQYRLVGGGGQFQVCGVGDIQGAPKRGYFITLGIWNRC